MVNVYLVHIYHCSISVILVALTYIIFLLIYFQLDLILYFWLAI